MLGELGSASLGAGMLSSTAAALLWLRSTMPGGGVRPARIATTASLLAALAGCVLLEYALFRRDFSVRFVAENGAEGVPLYFTLTSLWAALDGSLLLWLLIHSGYAALLSRQARRRTGPLHGYAMVVVSTVLVFFFALTYFAANPFRTVDPVPTSGPGPNPLLAQHPAMGVHPPLLYLGYIGLVVPFAFAVAALLCGRAGRGGWLAAARPWALVAWTALTAGIALGAWWSYAVLGWGGYWAWDPVENASLLPWLTATAFVHTALRGSRAGSRSGWNLTLACASFVLVLLGTFLTRSGAVESVHGFTESPLGPMLLGFVLLVVAVCAVLSGRRPPAPAGAAIRLLSRPGALLANGVLLLTIAAVVLIGTVFPLLSEPLAGVRTAVGPSYYNRTAVPLAVVLLVLMAVGPALGGTGRRATPAGRPTAATLTIPVAVALATVAAVGLLSRPGLPALAALGAGVLVLASSLQALGRQLRRAPRTGTGTRRSPAPGRRAVVAGPLAHAGVALVALGIAASSAYTASREEQLAVGAAVRVGDVSVRLVEVSRAERDGVMTVTARLRLTDGRGTDRTVRPSLRYHPSRDMTVSVPQISGGPLRDSYITLLAVAPDATSATVRLAVNPLVALIWAGAALVALGGLLAFSAAPWWRRRGPRGATGSGPPLVTAGIGSHPDAGTST